MIGIPDLIVWLIIIAGCVAIGAIAINQLGIKIPEWVKNICWVIVVVAVAVFAIRLIMRL